MAEYVGAVRLRNNFANFIPLYKYEDGLLVEMSDWDRMELLPESEMMDINFQLLSWPERPSEYFIHGECYVMDIDVNKLEKTGQRTGYRCDAGRMIDEGKLRPVDAIDLYYVLNSETVDGDFRRDQYLYLNDQYVFRGLKVMLEYDDRKYLLGPFTVQMNESRYYIDTEYTQNKYILDSVRYPTYYTEYSYNLSPSWEPEHVYAVLPPQAQRVKIDIISDEQLVNEFKAALSGNEHYDGKLDLDDTASLIKQFEESAFTGADLTNEIKKKRQNRLVQIITDEKRLNETLSDIVDCIGEFLTKYQNKPPINDFISRLIEIEDISVKLQGLNIVTGRVQEEEAKVRELQKQQNDLLEQISDAAIQNEQKRKEYAESLSESLEENISELKEQNNELEEKVASKKAELRLLDDYETLCKRIDNINKEIEQKENHSAELSYSIGMLRNRLDDLFRDKTEKAMNFAFDGMLANRMLRQAAEWEYEEHSVDYTNKVMTLKALPHSPLKGEELVNYLVNQVLTIRPKYGRNAVLNLFICYTQNFLTVLSGAPGTGKTSICRIMGAVLGLTHLRQQLDSDDFDADRFLAVAVERGWNSKRDFVGYYNPLTKTFDRNNRQLFNGLQILDAEAKNGLTDLPYMILLDEANLSPMEYYWAEFMSICDNMGQENTFNLGDDYIFRIPDVLRFVATINNDHTTEALSPRLIDRAFVVRLPDEPANEVSESDFFSRKFEQVSWSAMKDVFGYSPNLSQPMNGAAQEVYDIMLKQLRMCNISISPRIERAMKGYWSVAKNLFENEKGNVDASIVALDYALSQKVLPQINGTGEKYGERLKQALKLAQERNLRLTAGCLSEIIQRGEANMMYYQFFS